MRILWIAKQIGLHSDNLLKTNMTAGALCHSLLPVRSQVKEQQTFRLYLVTLFAQSKHTAPLYYRSKLGERIRSSQLKRQKIILFMCVFGVAVAVCCLSIGNSNVLLALTREQAAFASAEKEEIFLRFNRQMAEKYAKTQPTSHHFWDMSVCGHSQIYWSATKIWMRSPNDETGLRDPWNTDYGFSAIVDFSVISLFRRIAWVQVALASDGRVVWVRARLNTSPCTDINMHLGLMQSITVFPHLFLGSQVGTEHFCNSRRHLALVLFSTNFSFSIAAQ